VQPQQALARLVLALLVLALLVLALLVLALSGRARVASLVKEHQTSLVLAQLASLGQEHQASLVPERLARRLARQRDHQLDHPQDRQDPSSWARRWDSDLALRLAQRRDPDPVLNWDPVLERRALPLHVV
jgi:hypothetical protein